MPTNKQARGVRVGWIVFALLALFTAVEFLLSGALRADGPFGSASDLWSPLTTSLTLIAAAKAGLIVVYFMHISQLWHLEHEE